MRVVEIVAKPFKCTKCNAEFKTEKNIPRHMKQQHDENSGKYQCWFCKQLYQTEGNYNVHWKKAHGNDHLLYLKPEKVSVVGKYLRKAELAVA